MQVAIAKRALADDPHCGDQCAYWQVGAKTVLCVADGLGHGPHAEAAAQAAVDYVGCHLADPLADIFAGCDLALRRTCGAVMGIAVIDREKGTVTYGGVGDTNARIVGSNALHLAGTCGIVGGGYATLRLETVNIGPADLLIMCTDGVREALNAWGYDRALRADAPALARRILRDWARETDDAAVLVYSGEEG